jgi:hypothetical protein
LVVAATSTQLLPPPPQNDDRCHSFPVISLVPSQFAGDGPDELLRLVR